MTDWEILNIKPDDNELEIDGIPVGKWMKQRKDRIQQEGKTVPEDLTKLLRAAETLYKTGEYGLALNACELALSIAHNPEIYLIQIKIYFDGKQYERVLEIIGKMQQQRVMVSTAALYAMDSLRMMDRCDEAREMAEQIMEHEPENVEVQAEVDFQLALVERDQYNLDQALELAKKSFNLTPDKTFKRYLIADIYTEKRDYRRALAIYSGMLKQDPQDAFACFKIAEMYQNMDDPKRAERYYRTVLKINPKYKGVHCRLAGLFEVDIQYKKALEEINLQLKLDQHELYFCQKSDILLKLQRNDEAIATLEQALEIYPSGADILTNLAFIYKNDGHYREAADCFEKMLPGNALTYEWLAQCLKQVGDNKRREEVLNEGIEAFGQYFGLYYERAELWRDREQYGKMAEDGKMYVELAGCHAEAYLETGDAYYLMGDHDEEAVSWYEKGIEIQPEAWILWQAMGLVYRDRIGDYEKAIDCLEKALNYRTDPMYRVRDRRLLLTQLIEACEKQGDKRNLQKYVKAMLEILLERPVDEYDAEMFRQIGNCYLKLGNDQWAKPYLERADDEQLCKRYAGQSEEGLYDLGAIQEELGQEKEALEYYERALVLCRYENELNPCRCEKYEEAVRRLTEKKS